MGTIFCHKSDLDSLAGSGQPAPELHSLQKMMLEEYVRDIYAQFEPQGHWNPWEIPGLIYLEVNVQASK